MKTGLMQTLATLESQGSEKNVKGMARFGVTTARAFGVPAPFIRSYARTIGTNHELALQLWRTGILEARILAALVGDPGLVTRKLMNAWVKDFDNWAVCDGTCGILFDKTPFAFKMAFEWSRKKGEFVKRAGFVMMAELAVHNKDAPDRNFVRFLPVIKRGSDDERNFVKKAVNWALRQIGKRNQRLNAAAIKTAKAIRAINSPSARWIATDALRELENKAVENRLKRKNRN
jgi:3-methyladenine DNA glycosylase AlkD